MTSPPPILAPSVRAAFLEAAQVLKPPPKMTVSMWAERERILATESSAEGGRYRVSRAPYQRAMMDAVNIPGVSEVVYFTGAQLGKSTCTENAAGFFIDHDPGPILWMWPDDEIAKEWASDTLEPLIRETPALSRLIEGRLRTSANRAKFKKFPGGWLAVVGAKSASKLRRRRARIIIYEEIDALDASVGGEGDPIEITSKRGVTFWNFLAIYASTCTERGLSRIEARYEDTNKQRYWVPCPHCGEKQVLRWSRMSCPKNEEPTVDNTVYACLGCGAALYETDKPVMLARGEWRAERPEIIKRQGFWLSSLYSPFETWAKLMGDYRTAMAHRENPEMLKTFVTLSLAKTWEDREERLDRHDLQKRAEHYPRSRAGAPLLPEFVSVLTAGVDVQADRIELELVGWGKGEESASLAWLRFEGDTSKLESNDPKQPSPWQQLDEFLQRRFRHVRGPELEIASAFIDSGHHASTVYAFCKTRPERRVFACKGMSAFGHPPLGKWNRNSSARVRLYPVGVSQIKRLIYSRLRITEPGPGYCHFSVDHNDADYFHQLTCEQLKRKYQHGYTVQYWEKPLGARNEALDCRGYAYAAFLSLSENPARMLERCREALLEEAKELKERSDPNQLTLLDDGAPAVEQSSPVQEIADTAVRLAEVLLPIAQSNEAAAPEVAPVETVEPEPVPEVQSELPIRRSRNWASRW